MDKKQEKKSALSQSFVTGVIAAVFLIVGYQTAMFIHRAAVMKIAANRDEPDTVYVYMQPEQSSDKAGVSSEKVKTVRKNSYHAPMQSRSGRMCPTPKWSLSHLIPILCL